MFSSVKEDGSQTTTKDNKPEEQFNCDFEESECGWGKGTTNEGKFFWERFDYATCIDNYAAENCPDKREEDNTRWMYLSGSRGKKDDFASLISPENENPNGDCFMFMYNFAVMERLETKVELISFRLTEE